MGIEDAARDGPGHARMVNLLPHVGLSDVVRPSIRSESQRFKIAGGCARRAGVQHVGQQLCARALTEIFIVQTGNASCSPQLADSQELNLFASTHS